jgi:hypothetical protein
MYTSYLLAYEDGTDTVFRNDGVSTTDAGKSPRRKHKTGKNKFPTDWRNRHGKLLAKQLKDWSLLKHTLHIPQICYLQFSLVRCKMTNKRQGTSGFY